MLLASVALAGVERLLAVRLLGVDVEAPEWAFREGDGIGEGNTETGGESKRTYALQTSFIG